MPKVGEKLFEHCKKCDDMRMLEVHAPMNNGTQFAICDECGAWKDITGSDLPK